MHWPLAVRSRKKTLVSARQSCYWIIAKDMTPIFCVRTAIRVPLFLLLFALFATSLTAAISGKQYVVRKNDTLTEIARKHQVTVAALMKHNQIDQANRIHPGMLIRIPGPQEKGSTSSLDAVLRKKLDSASVTPKKWRYIVVHHSATESGTVAGMDRYHREERHMENGLAYHFVIGNGHGMGDGKVSIGKRWIDQLDGGHLASESLNTKSIGICLVGNFDQERPTQKQLASLESLVSYLLKRCRLAASAVKTHQQINPIHTRCPGQHFPAMTFVKNLK
jgi:LysM repeat protein